MAVMESTYDQYQALFEEVRKLHNRLRWIGDQVHAGDGLTAATRSLMLSLYIAGPQTVPDMARERLVSRQIIQTQINLLLEACWVETTVNPRHKRSSLIQLTKKGTKLMEKALGKERHLVERAGTPLSNADIADTAAKLMAVREHLEEFSQGLLQ